MIDPDALKQFQFRLFTKLEGAMTSGMVHLGDRLGLYRALADGGPLTSAELAGRTGLVERWVREWAYNQAAAGLVEVDDGERFSLTPEAVAVLADPDHEAAGLGLFHQLPPTMAALPAIAESFRTGIGHDYDSCGAEGAIGGERGFEPWNRAHLLGDVVPAARRCRRAPGRRLRRRRHRLRGGRRRDAPGRSVPGVVVRGLRHLAPRPRSRRTAPPRAAG